MRSRYSTAMMVTYAAFPLWMQGEAAASKWDDVAQFFTRKAVRGAVSGSRYLDDDGKLPSGIRDLCPPDESEQSGTQTQANGEGSLMLVLGCLSLATGGYFLVTDPDVRGRLKGTRRR